MIKNYLTPKEILMAAEQQFKYFAQASKNIWILCNKMPQYLDICRGWCLSSPHPDNMADESVCVYGLNIKYDGNTFDSLICRNDIEKENK